MLFAEKIRIEEYVVEMLNQESLTGPSLLSKVREILPNSTKQALYKSLRKLLENEVINKTGKVYSLNRTWLQKLRAFSNQNIENIKTVDTMNILNFEDGDSVVYQFKNPFLLDIIWGHLFDIIYDHTPQVQAILNYHPHEWLLLSRPETEQYWLNRIVNDKKILLFTIGGGTILDKKFKKVWQSENIKINVGESYGMKKNQYLSVLGDYVFEITTSEEFEEEVDTFFNKNMKVTRQAQKQINAISKRKYTSKLKLSRNSKKADKWRKKFKKDFFVSPPYHI